MTKFTRQDLYNCIITGLITGFVIWRVLDYLDIRSLPFSLAWFVILVPILWILGVNFGYWLGQWIPFFTRFGKFAAVGFTNGAVDFGVLYWEIASFGVASGLQFALYKTISFFVAMLHSYFWNKRWTFNADQSSGGWKEFFKFMAVTLTSLVINVIVATLVVNAGASLGHDLKLWSGLGTIVGSAAALVFSFLGFKMVVFKR
ncbi:MAG: GtrA family protein [Candidatus Yanofskybacteria bacterium]|nr:GtrA family protein [Candidatus Yanofskybacteria bacterium]